MSVMTGPLAAPPAAPGSITSPPGARTFLLYLESLGRWGNELREALGSLDRRSAVSSRPDDFTADLVLALSLSESIDRRTAELTKTWDSGRVGPNELAHIAQLIWSRLPDALGNPSAFTLTEATTLAAALEARLDARLDADFIAGSGAADRIAPLRDTLSRCRILSETLGRHGGEPTELLSALEAALAATTGPSALGAEIARIADSAELLERDLIKETSLRSAVESTAARLTQRLPELQALETQTRADAALCREKIADAPNLAVPDVDALGPIPPIPDGSQAPGSWRAVRAELDAYAAKVELVARALAEAARRFTAPLNERAELRGIADAYRAKAAAAGLVENPALDESYQRLRAVLWNAPCDLKAARPLVAAYSRAVQEATRSQSTQPAEPGADK
jgi:hypothetical protein